MKAFNATLRDGQTDFFIGADLPGVGYMLNFFSWLPAEGVVGTAGRAVDHVGFEVRNLSAFCAELEAKGIALATPYAARRGAWDVRCHDRRSLGHRHRADRRACAASARRVNRVVLRAARSETRARVEPPLPPAILPGFRTRGRHGCKEVGRVAQCCTQGRAVDRDRSESSPRSTHCSVSPATTTGSRTPSIASRCGARRTRSAAGRRSGSELLGKTSAELCPAPPNDPEYWVRHRALLEAREPVRDVVHTLSAGGGAAQQVSVSGAPAYSPSGDFVGYRGIARESGALADMERLLELEGALLRGLAEADDLASAVPLVVRLTCQLARFECGCYWSVDEATAAVRRVATSSANGVQRRSPLREGAPLPEWLRAIPSGSRIRRTTSPRVGAPRGAPRCSCPWSPPARRSGCSSSRRPKARRPTLVCFRYCAASPCSSVTCTRARRSRSACARASSGSRPRWRSRRSASRMSTTKAASCTRILSSARCSATRRPSCARAR